MVALEYVVVDQRLQMLDHLLVRKVGAPPDVVDCHLVRVVVQQDHRNLKCGHVDLLICHVINYLYSHVADLCRHVTN